MNLPLIRSPKEFDENFQNELWLDAAHEICRRHNLGLTEIRRAGGSEHVVFLIDERFVLKIYRPDRRCFERELKSFEFVAGKTSFTIPEIIQTGQFESLDYVLMTQIGGVLMTREQWLTLSAREQISLMTKLAVGLREFHILDARAFDDDWPAFVKNRAETFIARQIAHGVNQKVLDALPTFIEQNLPLVPTDQTPVFMHADVHFGNLRLAQGERGWQISGLFDFADSRCGFHEYEFLAVGVLMMQGQREIQREFFKAYGYRENDLTEEMRHRLMMLTMLYESADLRRYALRLKPEAVDFTLDELERGIWSFTD